MAVNESFMLLLIWLLLCLLVCNVYLAAPCTIPTELPQFESFNITAYSGRWFEIASSASFKFQSESGLICVMADYGLINSDPQVKISVNNLGLRVANQNIASAVMKLQNFSQGVCRDASFLMASESPFLESSNTLDLVADEDLSVVGETAELLSDQLIQLFDVARINIANIHRKQVLILKTIGHLSQLTNPPNSTFLTISGILDETKKSILAVQKICIKLRKFVSSISHLAIGAQKSSSIVAHQLLNASRLLGTASNTLSGKMAKMNSVTTAALAYASGGFMGNGMVQNSPSSHVNVSGSAIQSAKNPALLSLELNVFPGVTAKGSYYIVSVEEKNPGNYSAALVYGCSDDDLSETFYILSRERRLEANILKGFLEITKRARVEEACNPLTFTVQNQKKCGSAN